MHVAKAVGTHRLREGRQLGVQVGLRVNRVEGAAGFRPPEALAQGLVVASEDLCCGSKITASPAGSLAQRGRDGRNQTPKTSFGRYIFFPIVLTLLSFGSSWTTP